jgi:putative membrane protein
MKIQTLLMTILFSVILIPWDNAIAQSGQYGGWRMGPGMMGSNWGMGWFGMIFMLAFWVLVIIALIFLVKWLIQATSGKKAAPTSSNRGLEILKERYARGEIDKAEFDSKKHDIID